MIIISIGFFYLNKPPDDLCMKHSVVAKMYAVSFEYITNKSSSSSECCGH